mmetsp:Transcript_60263/g.176148  ORF Transcript_60263/g.176148 Transcript_60263/m.176148 type:complete len:316 (-) Transcript_60263:747-1694(-)
MRLLQARTLQRGGRERIAQDQVDVALGRNLPPVPRRALRHHHHRAWLTLALLPPRAQRPDKVLDAKPSSEPLGGIACARAVLVEERRALDGHHHHVLAADQQRGAGLAAKRGRRRRLGVAPEKGVLLLVALGVLEGPPPPIFDLLGDSHGLPRGEHDLRLGGRVAGPGGLVLLSKLLLQQGLLRGVRHELRVVLGAELAAASVRSVWQVIRRLQTNQLLDVHAVQLRLLAHPLGGPLRGGDLGALHELVCQLRLGVPGLPDPTLTLVGGDQLRHGTGQRRRGLRLLALRCHRRPHLRIHVPREHRAWGILHDVGP